MKLALLATVLLIGSNVVAVSGEKNLNFKLVTIYMGEKGGETARPLATAFTISRMEPLQ